MATEALPAPRGSRWTRSYPPLALLAVAVLIAALVLPSSLNLPQSNPSTVLEYAPVPPEDDNPPPPDDGSMASLGLGSSSSLQDGSLAPPPPPPPPPPDEGTGTRPQQKRCVAGRQTEDPMSPPCVPFFEGDNFGATYQGVTAEDIVVLVYFDTGGYPYTGDGSDETTPRAGTYVDIREPDRQRCYTTTDDDPQQCDFVLVRVLKSFQRYFPDRFQLYGRNVHYWAYFSNASTAAARRKDAQENWERLKPFAVIDQATFRGYNEAYQDAMAARGVMTFSSTIGRVENRFFRKNAPMSWGFWPDVERWARSYSSYVCQKVAPYRVRRFNAGQGSPNGEERRFGLYYTTDPAYPGLHVFREQVKQQLRDCGVEWETEAEFPRSGYAVDGSDRGTAQVTAVSRFEQNDVTTVLWLGGVETRFSAAADAAGYYPEIVIAGDLDNDNNFIGTVQNDRVWRNAWATTFHIRINRLADSPGYMAYKEGSPHGDEHAGVRARSAYYDHLMLFTGVQGGGPRLNPGSVEQGLRAMPERASTDPYQAACYFEVSDFSCVKDAAEQWWDPQGRTPSGNQPGCYRMVNEGHRSLSGRWSGGDDVFGDPGTAPCTGYGGGIRLRYI